MALADEEWRDWSSNKLAELCGVSHTFVDKVRSKLRSQSATDQPATVAGSEDAATVNALQLEPEKRLGADGKWRQVPPPRPETESEGDDEPANVQESELPEAELSEDAGDFNTDELEGVAPKATLSAAKAKVPKSGTEIVSTKLRKEAIDMYSKLVRLLGQIGIKYAIATELNTIEAAILEGDGSEQWQAWLERTGRAAPKDTAVQSVTASGMPIAFDETVATVEVEVDDDEGWGAPEPDNMATPMENAA
jgi:hypothetical protein